MRNAEEIPGDRLTKYSIVGGEVRQWCEVLLPRLRETKLNISMMNCNSGARARFNAMVFTPCVEGLHIS